MHRLREMESPTQTSNPWADVIEDLNFLAHLMPICQAPFKHFLIFNLDYTLFQQQSLGIILCRWPFRSNDKFSFSMPADVMP
ncbi:hypothetical protein OXYTRIMIC_045 [Oxytricha trifallax]|uniref:Uncharacterized protein n=1 Tax=Oxytricha trifallax TaxID=1172189 RepID=A0A073HX68_9SPIT|nr:hypothetical protein OXYTRIMIC_045 [Oxytricha trifallax]